MDDFFEYLTEESTVTVFLQGKLLLEIYTTPNFRRILHQKKIKDHYSRKVWYLFPV